MTKFNININPNYNNAPAVRYNGQDLVQNQDCILSGNVNKSQN